MLLHRTVRPVHMAVAVVLLLVLGFASLTATSDCTQSLLGDFWEPAWQIPQLGRQGSDLNLAGASLWVTWGSRDRLVELDRTTGCVLTSAAIDPSVLAVLVARPATEGPTVLVAGVRPTAPGDPSRVIRIDSRQATAVSLTHRILVLRGLPLCSGGGVVLLREDDPTDVYADADWADPSSGETAAVTARSLDDGCLLWSNELRKAPGWFRFASRNLFAPVAAVASDAGSFVVEGLWEREGRLAAFDIGSGAIRWARPFPDQDWLVPTASGSATLPGRLRRQAGLAMVDARTGRTTRTLSVPTAVAPGTVQADWPGEDGCRFVYVRREGQQTSVLQEADVVTRTVRTVGAPLEPCPTDLAATAEDIYLFARTTGQVTALDRVSGLVRWRTTLDTDDQQQVSDSLFGRGN